jgi:putative acetyltransferase
MVTVRIEPDDPARDDIVELLLRHLAFAHEHSPPEDVHALDLAGLQAPEITFYSARIVADDATADRLAGVGALKQLDPTHGEIKSMHTAAELRGNGIGRAMVDHLVAEARRRGYHRLSLETGTPEVFRPARQLYQQVGFEPCPPFADYPESAFSTCMTLVL